MGGQIFEETKKLDENKYNNIIDNINNLEMIKNNDYMFPMRLSNKKTHGDIDIILFDDEKFINLFEKKIK